MVKEFGYEYDAIIDNELFSMTKSMSATDRLFGAHCLRSGRDALKAIAREFAPSVVLIPTLSCESMFHPFELYGHEVRFYRLDENYSVEMNSLDFGDNHSILVYMDYFGKQSLSDQQLFEIKKRHNVTFVEDITHTLIWDRIRAFQPDYVIASLRKWLSIPDGGLLWGNISKPFSSELTFFNRRLEAQALRHNYLTSGDEYIKSEFRSIFSTVSKLIDDDDPVLMSMYSYCIAKNTDWGLIRELRKNNAKTLINILSSSPEISIIQSEPGLSDLYVAFAIDNRDLVQKKLSEIGIFNTTIWPFTSVQRNKCDVSDYTESHMLAAPCDQRYTTNDMEYIGLRILQVINDVNK